MLEIKKKINKPTILRVKDRAQAQDHQATEEEDLHVGPSNYIYRVCM